MKQLDIYHFDKKNDYLICIDSDGTAIDAMNAKHLNCHGPAFIDAWDLKGFAVDIQEHWNRINLYNDTRGVNRFIALVDMLEYVNKNIKQIDHIEVLKNWIDSKPSLSNKGLEDEISRNPHLILKKSLAWSIDINNRIKRLSSSDKPPFKGVRECLSFAKGKVDIAVISSSNMSAIVEEWTDHGLIEFLDVMTSQEIGTKGECLRQMIAKGYDPKHVLMIGDAYPDLDAAIENESYYYPILINKEQYSWDLLQEKYLPLLLQDEYGKVQKDIIKIFQQNFGHEGE